MIRWNPHITQSLLTLINSMMVWSDNILTQCCYIWSTDVKRPGNMWSYVQKVPYSASRWRNASLTTGDSRWSQTTVTTARRRTHLGWERIKAIGRAVINKCVPFKFLLSYIKRDLSKTFFAFCCFRITIDWKWYVFYRNGSVHVIAFKRGSWKNIDL